MPKVLKQTGGVCKQAASQVTVRPSGILARAVDVADLTDDFMSVTLYGVNRSGKCLGKDTPVLMYDGTVKAVQDVEVGDVLMGPDSRHREVLSTTTGTGPMYEIIPNKGDSWTCNDAHILCLTGCNGTRIHGKSKEITVTEYLEDLNGGKTYSDLWCLFRESVDFPGSWGKIDIDPYLVGLWMGDGSVGSANITNSRQEIRDYCREMAAKFGLLYSEMPERREGRTVTTYRIRFTTKLGTGGAVPGGNKFLNFFSDRCTVGRTKTIPMEYLTASREDRLKLLAGIVDTDGDASNEKSCTTVTVTGEAYRDCLLHLCRGLGFASYTGRTTTHTCASGKISTYYRVSINGDLSILPTRIKVFPERQRTNRVSVTRFKVEAIGEGEYFGFTLDGDGRFLLGDFTVTHNTTLACLFPKPLLLISFEPGRKEGGAKSVKKVRGVKFIAVASTDEAVLLARELREDNICDLADAEFNGKPYASHVIDTVTSCQDMCLKEIMGLDDAPVQLNWGLVGEDQYRERSEKTREVLRPFRDLPAHTVFVAQEKDHAKPQDKTSKLLRGQHDASFLAADLGGATVKWLHDACDVVVRLYMEREVVADVTQATFNGKTRDVPSLRETGRNVRRLRTILHPNQAAGIRSADPDCVPEYIESQVPKDMYDALMQVIDGKRTDKGKYS